MPLRPYQNEALSAVTSAYDNGFTRQLLTMATGCGKTLCFAHLPEIMESRLPGQMWIIAHREELIDQAVAKVRQYNPTLLVDKEMASNYANPLADVIVSSVASIGRKGTARANRFDWDAVTKIVIDEAHHSTATTYQNFLEMTGVLEQNSKKLLLGVTATPSRGDGKGLSKLYQKIVYSYPLRSAIKDKWLVDLRGYRVNTQVSLDEIKTNAGDFQLGDLADAVNNPARNALVVKAWQDKAVSRQTAVFTVDIHHALDLAEAFRFAGVKATAIWGDDPDRATKLARHKAGELTVLTNCGILTEGYDDPSISCIVLARPTQSATLYVQMVGRGSRLNPGKSDCLIIDICDTTRRHSLQTVPTLMGLDKDLDLGGALLLESAEAIEAAQAENPFINLSTLKDFSKLKAYIEDINLFDVGFPEEIEKNSKLSWHSVTDGVYSLALPRRGQNFYAPREHMTIKQNMLDQFEITALIHGKPYRGQRGTLSEALAAADAIVSRDCPEDMKVISRELPWHKDAATPAQKKMVRSKYKGRAFPFCLCQLEPKGLDQCNTCGATNTLTKGQAGRLIDAAVAKTRKVAA